MYWYDKIDRELADMPDYRLERLEKDFDPSKIAGRDLAKIEHDLQLQVRAGNELAKRRRDAARKQEQAEDERKHAEREAQRVEAVKAEYRKQARAAFPGNDAEFEAAWPDMWRQYQVEQTRQSIANARAGVLASGRYQGF